MPRPEELEETGYDQAYEQAQAVKPASMDQGQALEIDVETTLVQTTADEMGRPEPKRRTKRTMKMPQKPPSNPPSSQPPTHPAKQPSKEAIEVAAKILAKQAQKLAQRKAPTPED